MFENKTVEGIHYSRFIASWSNEGGTYYGRRFKEWLSQLTIDGRNLTEDEITDIWNLANNGKLELELNAHKFLTKA